MFLCSSSGNGSTDTNALWNNIQNPVTLEKGSALEWISFCWHDVEISSFCLLTSMFCLLTSMFCLLTSMEPILVPNYSLLYMYSNDRNSFKVYLLLKL